MMFRSGKKFSREVSIYDPIGADKDGETVSLLDVLEAEDREVLETVIIKQDVKILYEAYKENLTEMEQTVIRMRYGLFGTKEHTQREIAEKLGISGPMCRESRNGRWGICGRRFMSLPGTPCDTFCRKFLREGSLRMIRTEREVPGSSGFLPGTRGPEADRQERSCKGIHSLCKVAESRTAQLFYNGEKGIFRDRGARTDIGGDCRSAFQRPIGLIFFAVSPERIDGWKPGER